MSATATYTLVFDPEDGTLWACVHDGDDYEDALRLEEQSYGFRLDRSKLHVESGLTLTDTLIPGDADEIIWQDDDDLIGEDGDSYRVFKYAVRR